MIVLLVLVDDKQRLNLVVDPLQIYLPIGVVLFLLRLASLNDEYLHFCVEILLMKLPGFLDLCDLTDKLRLLSSRSLQPCFDLVQVLVHFIV